MASTSPGRELELRYRKGRRARLAVAITLLLIFGSTACGGGDDDGGEGGGAPGGDTLIIAIPATPPGIDLDTTSGPQTWLIAGQVYAKGFDYARQEYPFEPVEFADPTKIPGFTYPNTNVNELEPGIIESCELSDDGKTGTYRLRQGVMSAYGNEFTSADVLYSVERALGLKGSGAFFKGLANAGELKQWKATDKYTVEVTADSPMPLICVLNAHLFWQYFDSTEVKSHVTPDDPWATKWVSTNGGSFGAYRITQWQAAKQVVMEANEEYWRGAPKIKKIIWQVVPNEAGRVSLLKAGKVHIADSLSAEQIAGLSGESGVRVGGIRSPQELYVVMNNAKPPFDNPMVRQAINTAIPRSDIVESVYRGLAHEWQGPTPSVFGGTGYVERSAYDYDPDAAKALLDEAGLGNGFDTTLSYNAGDPVQEQVAILLRDSLKQIGVNVQLQKLPSAAIQDLIFSGNDPASKDGAEFAIWIDAPFFPESQFVTQILFYPGLGDFENYGQTQPDFVKKIDSGRTIVGAEEREAYFGELQEKIYSDAPVVWISEPYFLVALRDNVSGYGVDVFPFFEVRRMALQ